MNTASSQSIPRQVNRRETNLTSYVIKLYGLVMLLLSVPLALGGLVLPVYILYQNGIALISIFEALTTAASVFGFAAGSFKWGSAIMDGKRSGVIGLCVVFIMVFTFLGWISFASGMTRQGWNIALTGICVTVPILLICLINWRKLDRGSEIYAEE